MDELWAEACVKDFASEFIKSGDLRNDGSVFRVIGVGKVRHDAFEANIFVFLKESESFVEV